MHKSNSRDRVAGCSSHNAPEGSAPADNGADTAPVTVRLLELERVRLGRILAFASVEIAIAGIAFEIHGLTIRKVEGGRVAVDLPTFSREGRAWPAITLPTELNHPAGEMVFAEYMSTLPVAAR
jgi:hypothetical protein